MMANDMAIKNAFIPGGSFLTSLRFLSKFQNISNALGSNVYVISTLLCGYSNAIAAAEMKLASICLE